MSDEHLVALQGIWSEMKTLNQTVNGLGERIDETNRRLDETNRRVESGFDAVNRRIDQTNERLDRTNEHLDRLEHVQKSAEIRVATELVNLHTTLGSIHEVIKGGFREDRLLRIAQLERRVDALEKKPP
jgi:hypothetical protein